MSAFLSCPTELLDSILENVSTRDLVAVSLTSKRLYTLATPLLYSQIDFYINRDCLSPLLRLSRSIFHKPELGTYVKSVRLRDGEQKIQDLHRGSWRHQDHTPIASPEHPTAEDGMNEFVSFVSSSGLSYADLWIEKLREGDLNAFVALLLSKLPNLTNFRVGYAVVLPYLEATKSERVKPKTAGENQFLGKIFQSAVFDRSDHGLPRFEHLEHISFPGPMDTDPGRNPDFCNPQDLMALLSLPSIQSVKGWSLNPSTLPFSWPSAPPELTRLTSLSLSYVHVDFLAQILERTHALKRLNWEWKYIPDIDPLNSDTIDLDRFVEALKHVQDTLDDLTISATNNVAWDDYDFPAIHVRGSLNGLATFMNIKKFRAPLALLLPDWDVDENPARRMENSMPPNVETVTVTDGTTTEAYAYNELDEMEKLRSWINETASARTPHLKEICLYLVRGSNWVEYEQYHLFEQVFEGSSLKHCIIKGEDEEPWNDV